MKPTDRGAELFAERRKRDHSATISESEELRLNMLTLWDFLNEEHARREAWERSVEERLFGRAVFPPLLGGWPKPPEPESKPTIQPSPYS